MSEHEVEKLRLYSDPACTDLLKTAAVHFGLQPDQIMPGNGSDENLFFALRAFCDETHPLAYADITYGCYSVWCGLMHIPSHIIPLKEDFTLDPADYYGLNETIVIANPNAPTGLALPRSAIEGILKALEDADTYGIILRAKGYVANAEGEKWIHFDYVPGEPDIRDGGAMVTGRICVIGSKLNEEAVAKLFGVEKQ